MFPASMRRLARLARLGALLAATSAAMAAPRGASTGDMEGFSPSAAAVEAALEQRFDAGLSAQEQRDWMQSMSSEPNHVGSAHDKANAEFMLRKFREWGWDASIETFMVLYPTPRDLAVELVAPTHFSARLREPPVEGDATSEKTRDELPPYNVYGADGDITAELVYVNQGTLEDYKELDRQRVSVKGRIVIVRYGGGWRGLKPKLAYEHGAVGCLIFSDPRDDGYGAGDVYPKGGYRPPDGVQRGSVQDMTLYSGDPLTPGMGATPGAKRLTRAEAKTLMKIPVLPISYADAEPLLAALGGRVAPPAWRGGLALTYHLGPGPAKVRLKVLSDWNQKPIYDVIATLRGAVEPDRWIIRGNHHDAWVFGATDPLSGNVALMSEAEAIGKLAAQGWRPRRSIVYTSWDGEEPGLLGSTEWVETHAAELKAKAALYINSDTNGRGLISVEGSHGLRHFASQVARDVGDPETGVSVLARSLAAERVQSYEGGGRPADGSGDLPLGALGSGSDYTPFLQHLGINSLNLGFGGETQYGVYHSAYDSFDHFRRFGDPTFEYGVALAKVSGRLVLRAAQAELLPERAADFANSVGVFTEELHKLADGMRASSRELDQLLDDGVFGPATDPSRPRTAPQRESAVPFLEFAELDTAVEKLKQSAKAFDIEYLRLCSAADAGAALERERMNAALTSLEQTLLDARGLPGRAWYQHMIFAPGAHTGYGAKTLPGIREAIEDRRWNEANQYVGIVAHALNAYGARLDAAIAAQ
jgi:N-acetylated-alpha-linked acidic dipeptidase